MYKFYYIPKEKALARQAKKKKQTLLEYILKTFAPFLLWLKNYQIKNLHFDVIAGLTVSAILIPQAMAYAFLVGLPPQMGLYSALPAVILSALFGSSKHVITGPVGIVSLLTITVLIPFAEVGSPHYIALAIALAFGIGVVQLVLGIFKFGFLARLIPHSVIIGFSTAAAIIIGSTQVPALLGYHITQKEHVFQTFIELFKHIHNTHFLTFIVGIIAFTFIFVLKKLKPKFPASLVAIAIGLILSYVFSFESMGIAIIGTIPSEIPKPSLNNFHLNDLFLLINASLIIGMVGFVESFSIAKTIANQTKDKISANQELIGQGVANIGASIMGGLPVSGSFSSTSVNFGSGAKTGVSALVVGFMVIITLTFFTPILYFLPRTILAAVVIAGVLQLVDIKKFKEAFEISRTDGTVSVLTFLTAFAFKPDDAVIVGVVLALLLFLQRIMWAHVFEEGFDHRWGHILRTAGKKDGIETVEGMIVTRVDMSIFYANVDYVIAQMQEIYDRRKHSDNIKMFVIDTVAVNYIDLTALEALATFLNELRAKNIKIYFMYSKTPQRKTLRKAKDIIGKIKFIHNVEELHNEYNALIK